MPRSAKVLSGMRPTRHRTLMYAGAASLFAHVGLVVLTRSAGMAAPALRPPVDTWAGDPPLGGDLVPVEPLAPTEAPTPASLEAPPSQVDPPPHREDHPPAREDPPPHREDHPPAREDPPPHREDHPPSRDGQPQAKEDPPPRREDHPPSRKDPPPSRDGQPPARATVAPLGSSGAAPVASAAAGDAGSFGAEGQRRTRSLGRAFTRALPAACVGDARWAAPSPGDAGSLTVRITLDEAGKIAGHEVLEPDPPPALVRSVERTLAMLRAGTFMTHSGVEGAGEDLLRLRAKVIDGEAPADSEGAIALEQSWSGERGAAAFTQRSGRRVEFVIERVKTP